MLAILKTGIAIIEKFAKTFLIKKGRKTKNEKRDKLNNLSALRGLKKHFARHTVSPRQQVSCSTICSQLPLASQSHVTHTHTHTHTQTYSDITTCIKWLKGQSYSLRHTHTCSDRHFSRGADFSRQTEHVSSLCCDAATIMCHKPTLLFVSCCRWDYASEGDRQRSGRKSRKSFRRSRGYMSDASGLPSWLSADEALTEPGRQTTDTSTYST